MLTEMQILDLQTNEYRVVQKFLVNIQNKYKDSYMTFRIRYRDAY